MKPNRKKVPEACRGLWNFFYAKMLTDDFQTKPIMLTDGFQTESIMLKWGHGVRKLLRAPQAGTTICISYGLLRASHSCNPTGMRISRVRASSSYLLPSKSHPVSYTRFARDDPVCVFEELIQYINEKG